MEMESGESVVLSIQQRMDILKDWETSSIANVAKKYKIDHATIWRIQQNATTIAGFVNKGKPEEHRKNLKEPIYEELEKHLLVWCIERRAMGDVISDEQLLEKAAELKKGFGDCPNLKISKGWLGRFKRRHKGPLARTYDGKPTAEDQDKDRDEIINENRNEQIDEGRNGRSEEEIAVDVGDYGIKMSQEERQELEAAFMRLERYRDRIPLSARFHLNGVKLTMLDKMAEDGAGGSGNGSTGEATRLQLLQEMRQQNFDSIRFASYRTACKLRFIQKKVHLHNVDIWNVIEAFRENGLNTLEPSSTLGVSRLETLLSSLFHALNKRVPVSQQAKVDATTALLMNWLLAAYTSGENNKISVFSVKVALATLCAGKLMDKFRYIYSQISDSNGHMIHWRFVEYLKEVLALTAAVYETPSFGYTEGLSNAIFPQNLKVTVNDFLDTLMSDPGPNLLIWLPLYHRMAAVENVAHPVMCDVCHKENFTGFRYRCQKCHSYQLCQDCFWRGKVSGTHNNDHETREYSSFKSPSKQIGHSLRKSFRCVPEKGKNSLPRFPEQPEKTLDLSHIVPPSPLPSHNGFPDPGFMAPFDSGSMDSRSTLRSMDSSRLDDEHKLIARYAQRLAQEARTMPRASSRMSQAEQAGRAPSDANLVSLDASRAQRELISQLEAKNKEIMREIARLRRQQEIEAAGLENPALMSELRALRQKKDELETHLATLQDSRRQLMVQLEGLMKMLKNHQASPRSTPNSSPRSTKSPPLPPGAVPSSRSAPPTPGGPLSTTPQQQQQQSQCQQQMSQSYQNPVPTTSVANVPSNAMLGTIQNPIPDNLSCVGGDVRSAFRTNSLPGSGSSSANNSLGRSLRNDLLVAADSVTNAMSTLVRELNSDSDQEDHSHNSGRLNIRKPLDFEAGEDGDDSSGGGNSWREELQRRYQQENDFLAELRARNVNMTQTPSATPSSEQEQERGEREEADGEKEEDNEANWTEPVKRWVNR